MQSSAGTSQEKKTMQQKIVQYFISQVVTLRKNTSSDSQSIKKKSNF